MRSCSSSVDRFLFATISRNAASTWLPFIVRSLRMRNPRSRLAGVPAENKMRPCDFLARDLSLGSVVQTNANAASCVVPFHRVLQPQQLTLEPLVLPAGQRRVTLQRDP